MGLYTHKAGDEIKIGALSLSPLPFLAFSDGRNCRQSSCRAPFKEMESHHKRERMKERKEYKYSSPSVLHSPNICGATYRLSDSSKSSSSSNV